MKKNFMFVAGRILAIAALMFMLINPAGKMFCDATLDSEQTQYGVATIAVLIMTFTLGVMFVFVMQIASRDYKYYTKK